MSLLSWSPPFYYYCQSLGHTGNSTDLQTFLVVRSWNLQILPISTSLNLQFCRLWRSCTSSVDCNTSFRGKRVETCLRTKISGISLTKLQTYFCQVFKLSAENSFLNLSRNELSIPPCHFPPSLPCQNSFIWYGIKSLCPHNALFLGLTLSPFQALIFKMK